MARFRAALVQAEPVLGDVKANTATVVDGVRRSEADLVVFPELFLSGYGLRDEVHRVAEPLEGPALAEVAAACRAARRTCVVGFPRRVARGVTANSVAVVGPEGVVGAYDKVHLPSFSVFEEGLHFRPGAAFPVFDTPVGRLGVAVCYDLFFPEATKALALAGADVLVCPSASPTISRRYFEAVLPARAIETTSFLLYANLVGRQDQTTFWGGAQAWGPRGDLLARGPDDAAATTSVDVDLADLDEARRKRPALRDTRPEALRALVEAAGRPE